MAETKADLEVVTGLDFKKYQGRWYEIASMPSRFQPKDGTNTRATYTLKEDGTVGVLNETFTGGKRGFIEGKAWKAEPKNDEAKFKVRFWVPPFLPLIPVTGNYWVLALDEEYRWAVVGEPSRNYLWILSRTPELSDETYQQLLEVGERQGFDVSKLHKTPQPGGGDQNSAADDKHGSWWFKSLIGS